MAVDRHQVKRCLLVLTVVVPLGGVLNVAVALACGLWSTGEAWTSSYGFREKISATMSESFHTDIIIVPEQLRDVHEPSELPNSSFFGWVGFGRDQYMVTESPKGIGSEELLTTAAVFAGWPIKSTWGFNTLSFVGPPDNLTTKIEQGHGLLILDNGRCVPYAPIWSGVFVNTAFYSTILAILWFGPRGMRRWWRSGHGRCPSCGYILVDAAAACPECGQSI